MNLQQQKYLILFCIGSLNFVLIYTFILFNDVWYAYLCFLILASFLNASASILNIGFRMIHPAELTYRKEPRNYLYVIPCYNESEEELRGSLHSLIEQRIVKNDKRLIVIICDGKVKGAGNSASTDLLLKNLLQITADGLYYKYKTWDERENSICVYTCDYTFNGEMVPIILFVKENNYGKRDSLVLIRRICYLYNMQMNRLDNELMDNKFMDNEFMDNEFMDNEFMDHALDILTHFYHGERLDYIIGIDADTIFDYNCTYELIEGIDKDKNIHGCVGFVDIHPKMNFKSLFVLYQYAEYIYAQCLRRQAQSNITHKVSCLSGCNQILRVSEETCGEKILSVFNYFPKETDDIFKHIRSYASEDRNHVCNMLSLYPHVQTTQTLKAISYTVVPTSVSVFLSQRRRWNLGANTNDMLLISLPGINIFERILALVNVSTFTLTPFVVVATVYFVIAIIKNPTLLMLYLSILIFIPFFYSFLIPLFIKPSSFKDTLYYYLSFLFFLSFGSLVGLTTFTYATLKMDIIKWGKTRLIAESKSILKISEAKISETLNEELRIVTVKTEWNDDNHILNFDIIV